MCTRARECMENKIYKIFSAAGDRDLVDFGLHAGARQELFSVHFHRISTAADLTSWDKLPDNVIVLTSNLYLGTHEVHWLEWADFSLFVSRRRLQGRKRLPRARHRWFLDSGGFTELLMYGEWTLRFSNYVALARRFRDEVGLMAWAAPQDWMCEPFILEKTRSTVQAHQRRTVINYVALMESAPDVPWIPVLQGWTTGDYLRCIDLYARYRVDLTKLPVVGVGSICRRQGETKIALLLEELKRCGIRSHGFGLKLKGLALAAGALESADSMAWSFDARRKPTTCGSKTHKNCANCYEYAKEWRDRALGVIERATGSPVCPVPTGVLASGVEGGLLP